MQLVHKVLLNLIIVVCILVLVYSYYINESRSRLQEIKNKTLTSTNTSDTLPRKFRKDDQLLLNNQVFKSTVRHDTNFTTQPHHIWLIFTKVSNNIQMKKKFERFSLSLMRHASVNVSLHLIVDNSSQMFAQDILNTVKKYTQKNFEVFYYEVTALAQKLEDIVQAMQPHFSSQPGTYYSDALFFLSLGLERVATEQKQAIMFDADTKLLVDVAELFKEFEKFSPSALFGLAPELTPVYRHILYAYRSKQKTTRFGNPVSQGGFPGLNSGVILFQLDRIRASYTYRQLLSATSVASLTSKYNFKGHLGDQDFYTLLGAEHPQLVHMLGCGWNRQLCTWWRSHGYEDIFDEFFHCKQAVKVYHGNCNTPIPD